MEANNNLHSGELQNNSTNCPTVSDITSTWKAVLSFMTLIALNVIVIVGNTLVIVAVYVTKNLRTVTNHFIVSLACADLMVGVTVLPYSLTLEVLDVWVFGEIWCRLWLAIDVLCSTASILNLCAISLDRFIAITKPISYPATMSSFRGNMLIGLVWVSAFFISIPPLLGWNEDRKSLLPSIETDKSANGDLCIGMCNDTLQNSSTEIKSISTAVPPVTDCNYPQCDLIGDKGYRIYSAMGSFFIPMFIMCFFYWRIYVAAVKSSREMQRGFKEVHRSNNNATASVLRIHRGGGGAASARKRSISNPALATSMCSKYTGSDITRGESAERLSKDSSPSPRGTPRGRCMTVSATTAETELSCKDNQLQTPNERASIRLKSVSTPNVSRSMSTDQTDTDIPQQNGTRQPPYVREENLDFNEVVTNYFKHDNRLQKIIKFRKEFKKFSREMKAAKTLAIIVGAFILCWLPFFTIYFIGAFCLECIPPIVFSITFWLGYCNSGVNPVIYAMFSHDYRHAFKKVLSCSRYRSRRYRSGIGFGKAFVDREDTGGSSSLTDW